MTDRDLMQEALDALQGNWRTDESDKAIEALRAALAQPEPKPVAWMLTELDGTPLIDCGDLVVKQRPVLVSDKTDCIPLYTAPPQREWVGLTTDELEEIAEFHFHGGLSGREFYDDIEAKLKEKNNG